MNYPILKRGMALAAALGVCGAFAQTRPAAADPGIEPTVLTDAGPAPAQERSSLGAIVLSDSPVRAQRKSVFEMAAQRTGVASVGRGVLRATMKAQREADLAQSRENEAVEMYRRGSGGLIEK